MEECTRVNGTTITWKDMVSIHGKTVENTKDNTGRIKSMDSEITFGLMEGNMKVGGTKENNMF
jgi:hypothetical protein